MALPDAVLTAGDGAPELLPSEREEDDLPSPLKTDFADLNQCAGPDFFLPSAIWDKCRSSINKIP